MPILGRLVKLIVLRSYSDIMCGCIIDMGRYSSSIFVLKKHFQESTLTQFLFLKDNSVAIIHIYSDIFSCEE